MILTGNEIARQVEKGNIVISPFSDKQLNSNSYNLRLSDELLVYGTDALDLNHDRLLGILDMAQDNPTTAVRIPEQGLVLQPNTLYLGATLEHTETRGFVPCIEGRSSVGRLGLQVHHTAGFGETGFKGTWTLELSVIAPLRVYAGVEICQIYYFATKGKTVKYRGKYQGQRGPRASQLWRELVPAGSDHEKDREG